MTAVVFMKVSGTQIDARVLASKSILMGMSTRVSINNPSLKVMVSTDGLKVTTMKDSGSRVRDMGKGYGKLILVRYMMVIGTKVKHMGMGPWTCLMGTPIQATGLSARSMAMGRRS